MKRRLLLIALTLGTVVAATGCNGEAGVVLCHEDEVAVIAPDRADGKNPLWWVCVNLRDFADDESVDRLDAILADR